MLIVPAVVGLIVHVTAVLALPVTVAVNCWVCPALRLTVVGLTETLTPDVPPPCTIWMALIFGFSTTDAS